MLKDFFCAYHNTHLITNFCKCQECLLPVCPTCIRLHSEEHSLLKTDPDYEHINEVFKDVRVAFSSFEVAAKKLANKLIRIEEVRKENGVLIRKKIIDHKKKLVREFERALTKMEQELVQSIVREDENFIEDLEAVDDKIIGLERKLERERRDLEVENTLKSLIDFYGENKKQKIEQAIDSLNYEVQNLATKSMYVCFDEGYLEQLERVMKGYMSIRTMDWQQ